MALSLLATQPVWLSGTLLVGMMTLIAMSGAVLVRRFVRLDRLRANNEVAGFMFATVGVLYAVLLGFALLIAWEKFSEAESAVAQEASAFATLYRLAEGVGGGPGNALRSSGAYSALLTFAPSDSRGATLLAEALHQLDVLTRARRTRLILAPGVIPRELWFV